jgi:hypothetical protein
MSPVPGDAAWLEPWTAVDAEVARRLERELAAEISGRHGLFGRKARAIARRIGQDDVLFVVDGLSTPLAVVHLTWSGRRESDPIWPTTRVFTDWHDWAENCMRPDHEAYRS